MKQIRKRVTYANVMSSIAVFLVLGGGAAYAAQKIGSNEIKGNAITTGKIKKEAVTASKIKANSITTSKIADGAVTGPKVNLSTLGTVPNANNANNLGGVSSSGYEQKSNILFATVAPANGSPAIVRGQGATGVTSIGTGYFGVKFNRDVSNCTWIATYGAPNFSGIEGYFASVKGGTQSNEVRVVIWDSEGNQVNGLGFHLEVLCP